MDQSPKVELHLHLDCSLSYEVVARLDPAVSRADFDRDFVAPAKCTSLVDFLTRAPRGFRLMQTEPALRMVVEDVFEQLQADHVIYAEIRFAPLLHLSGGLSPAEVVAAVERTTAECVRATGIDARLILCTLRHYTEQQGLETAGLVDQFRGSLVAALDLAGDEAGFPIDAHIAAYRYAIERGLSRTAHAGEARGADSVWETLRAFKPSRIGHGVRSAEDPALLEHLRRTSVHLEVCPTSNVQTCVCYEYADHPIETLRRAGVSLGISTDTRTITNITLQEEYRKLAAHFGWDRQQFLRCNLDAIRAAFAPQAVKDRIEAQLLAAYGEEVGRRPGALQPSM
jgi:adenosine deaminase